MAYYHCRVALNLRKAFVTARFPLNKVSSKSHRRLPLWSLSYSTATSSPSFSHEHIDQDQPLRRRCADLGESYGHETPISVLSYQNATSELAFGSNGQGLQFKLFYYTRPHPKQSMRAYREHLTRFSGFRPTFLLGVAQKLGLVPLNRMRWMLFGILPRPKK